MAEQFSGKVEITDSAANPTITLNGNNAKVSGGGSGKNGEIRLKDGAGITRIVLAGKTANIILSGADGKTRIQLFGQSGYIASGGNGTDGTLDLLKADNHYTIRLASKAGFVSVGGAGTDGKILAKNAEGKNTITLDAKYENIIFKNSDGKMMIRLLGKSGEIASTGYIASGGAGTDGAVLIKNAEGKNTVTLDAKNGNIIMRNSVGKTRIQLLGKSGYIASGGNGTDGTLDLLKADDRYTIRLASKTGSVIVGGAGTDGTVLIKNANGDETIDLDARTGDIRLRGADCAEEFDVVESERVDSGTVLVIDDESKLSPCKEPYDKKVAGVVSGGNGSNPGIILDKNPVQTNRLPIALNGKVYCKVDAQYSTIKVGDLLTTSPTAGHAMKADDPSKAFGAVIGKALRPLKEGKGLIPILVALQ